MKNNRLFRYYFRNFFNMFGFTATFLFLNIAWGIIIHLFFPHTMWSPVESFSHVQQSNMFVIVFFIWDMHDCKKRSLQNSFTKFEIFTLIMLKIVYFIIFLIIYSAIVPMLPIMGNFHNHDILTKILNFSYELVTLLLFCSIIYLSWGKISNFFKKYWFYMLLIVILLTIGVVTYVYLNQKVLTNYDTFMKYSSNLRIFIKLFKFPSWLNNTIGWLWVGLLTWFTYNSCRYDRLFKFK